MMQHDEQLDLETLESYAKLLEANAPTIALAMYCGAYIGRAARSGERGEQMLVGLRVLADALNFEKATAEEVCKSLESMVGKIETDAGAPQPFSLNDLKLDRGTLDPWSAKLGEVVYAANPMVPIDSDTLRNYRRESMSLWRERCIRLLKGTTTIEPELADLFSRANGGKFFELLKFDLAAMTLRNWSEAHYSASKSFHSLPESRESVDYCPIWLGIVSLHKLGFHRDVDEVRAELYKPKPAPDEHQAREYTDEEAAEMRSILSSITDDARLDRSRFLVIRQDQNSITDPWQLTAKNTALVVTSQEYMDLRQLVFTDFKAVILEAPIAFGLAADILGPLSLPFWYIAANRQPDLDAPLVIAPKDLDDAVSRGQKGLTRRARVSKVSQDVPQDVPRDEPAHQSTVRRRKLK